MCSSDLAAAALGWVHGDAWAAQQSRQRTGVLSGTEFDLTVGETPVNITGRARTALTINGSLPGPTLRWREGEVVTLRVANRLHEDTTIHWHGIVLPANMDGVPGMSFHGIGPSGSYTYRFRVQQSGTYWYHSHSGYQEQQGVYGALVIEPRTAPPLRADREHVILLTDWTDEDPASVYRHLKKQSSYYNYRRRTLVDFVRDVRRNGFGATWDERAMWGRMRMSASDLADVTGSTYTYLMNGQPPAANWTGQIGRAHV